MSTTFTEGTMQDGKKVKPFNYLPLGDDVVLFTGTAAATDGTSGTGAGVAGPGSIYIRSDTVIKAYINGGTKASPTWGLITSV